MDPTFDRERADRAMALALIDVVFHAIMVGFGEVYFLADAVRLGASPVELALLGTLPLFIGSLGGLISLRALGRFGRRKPIVLLAAAVQIAALAAITTADLTDLLTPVVLIGLACAYQIGAQAHTTAWSSWYGDLVPAEIRGRYFARRNRAAHVSTCLSLIGAGLLLQYLEPGAAGKVAAGAGGLGFAITFGVAAVAKVISASLLARAPEPRFQGIDDAAQTARRLVAEPGRPLLRLLGVATALQLVTYASSPYFVPFMLGELHLTYVQYMCGAVAVVLLKVISLPGWGRAIDRYGARSVYLLALVLVGLVPLPWVWAEGVLWVIAAQMFSGFSWGGHEVAHFALVLERSDARTRPWTFALLNVCSGTVQLAGSIIGGLVLAAGGYRVVFFASTVGRLLVAAAAPLLVPADTGRRGIGRRRLLLEMMGFRPSGGVNQQALPVVEEEQDEPPPVAPPRQ
jgi:MFS family permease